MTFAEIVRVRRSFRKYGDQPIEPEKWELLKQAALFATRSMKLPAARLFFINEPSERKKVARAAFSGLIGKINPWLPNTKAPGLIALCGKVNQEAADMNRAYYLADAAMALEAVVLTAAELGLGTCWLGGIGENKLTEVLQLPPDIRVVALTPVGYPPPKGLRLDWDSLARMNSKKRKSLDEICRLVEEGS